MKFQYEQKKTKPTSLVPVPQSSFSGLEGTHRPSSLSLQQGGQNYIPHKNISSNQSHCNPLKTYEHHTPKQGIVARASNAQKLTNSGNTQIRSHGRSQPNINVNQQQMIIRIDRWTYSDKHKLESSIQISISNHYIWHRIQLSKSELLWNRKTPKGCYKPNCSPRTLTINPITSANVIPVTIPPRMNLFRAINCFPYQLIPE